MPGLLFAAYQKFYSAVLCLERFEKEQNFFDNISSLDNFFTEYRNITFVMQAALKRTAFFSIYEKNRDQYLVDHWFVEKRNETTKQQPFQLVKNIDVTIYFPDASVALMTRSFTVENDIPLDSLNKDLKNFFAKVSPDEVFFSVSFSFFEKKTKVNLCDKLIAGISSMKAFMDAMYDEVGENCNLCNQLREKINKSKFLAIPKDFWLINDYVYYPSQDVFERGRRMIAYFDTGYSIPNKMSVTEFTKAKDFNYDGTPFGTFVLMHAMLCAMMSPRIDLMPVFLIVYNDGTCVLEIFHTDIKTTIYRKITELAQKIKDEDIRQICFASLYSYIPNIQNASKTSKERIAISSKDLLVCISIDQELNEIEYVFDGDAFSNRKYIDFIMKHGRKNKLELGKRNMTPILIAFESKKRLFPQTEEGNSVLG